MCPGWTIDVSDDVPLIGESIELNRGAVVDAGSVARATVSDCLSALCECLQSRCRVLDHECESVGRENVGACEPVRLDGTDFRGLLWRGTKNPRKQLNVSGCLSDRSRNRRVPCPKRPPEASFERNFPPKRASELCPCRLRKSRLGTTINIHRSGYSMGLPGEVGRSL
jgi:hypothetical protein